MHRLPVLQRIHIMNHADLHPVGFQAGQQVLKPRAHLVDVPGALILFILPDRAQVRLQHKFLPPPPQGTPQLCAHLGVGGVQVNAVYPRCFHLVHQGVHLGRAFPHKALAAHTDLAYPQPTAA